MMIASTMMEMVGNPVAVNPEKELRKVAEERGWPILEFQRPVSLGEPLRNRVPKSGALVAAVVGGFAVATLLRKKRV